MRAYGGLRISARGRSDTLASLAGRTRRPPLRNLCRFPGWENAVHLSHAFLLTYPFGVTKSRYAVLSAQFAALTERFQPPLHQLRYEIPLDPSATGSGDRPFFVLPRSSKGVRAPCGRRHAGSCAHDSHAAYRRTKT